MIEETESDSKKHLCNTQDDRHLHLEGVGEGDLVLGQGPDLVGRTRGEVINIASIGII